MRTRVLVLLFGLSTFVELGVIAYFASRSIVGPTGQTTSLAVSRPAEKFHSKIVTNRASPFNWSIVESADYKTYISNLRAIGCPEETVRDIIIADIDKLLASRNRVIALGSSLQYWQPEEREVTIAYSEESGLQEQALEKEKHALIKELLGIDYSAKRRKARGEEDPTDRRLAFLPESTRDQVKALLEKYSALERAFQQKTSTRRSALTPEDRAELKSVHDGRQAELAKILTPREAELYELWMSNAAVATRFALGGMDESSEQDFLAIFNIRKRVEQEFDPETLDTGDRAVMEKWSQASVAAEEQIRAQLGEAKFAQYQRGQDSNYRQLVEIGRQYNLPAGAAGKIYDLKKRMEEAAAKMITDQSVSEPDRIATLGPIRREAEQSVRELMGETAYQQYRRNGNADWLAE